MKEKSSKQKSLQPNKPSAGPDGAAIAPPVYGINPQPVSANIIQRKADPATGSNDAGGSSPNRTGLPNALKAGVESLSGLALDDVRVHTNSSKPAQLQALAYTQGADIYIAPGQERYLPHEAWHVVQQKQGRVSAATMQAKSTLINDDPALEVEADRMGSQAAHAMPDNTSKVDMKSFASDGKSSGGQSPMIVQRVVSTRVAGGAAATITNLALTRWITANASQKVKAIAANASVDLRVIWDAGLGNPAATGITFSWADGVNHGPFNLFNANLFDSTHADYVGPINFDDLTGYQINVRTNVQTPQQNGATWQGTLIHEFETHTGLAYTTMNIMDAAIADRNKHATALHKIYTSVSARDVVSEHRNWASGGGGAEESTTRVVNSAPRAEKIAIVVDIAEDRIREANDNWPAPAIGMPDPHRIEYNTAMGKIRKWLKFMKRSITRITLAEAGQIDAQILSAADR